MEQGFIKRDFSISKLLSKGLLKDMVQGVPVEETFFWEMWTECLDIANEVRNTAYFKMNVRKFPN